MHFRSNLILVLALATPTASMADTLAYLISADPVTGVGQFGTVNLSTGAYQQIGPTEPDGYFGLAVELNGSLLSMTYTGGLDSIDPGTGIFTRIGATELASCGFAGDPGCSPTSAFSLGASSGTIYATDFKNSVYVINPSTAATTLLALHSGIPPTPFILGSQNSDGTLNFADEAIWSAGGKLYATYDALTFDPSSNSTASVVIAPELYQIDPATGLARTIGPTDLGIGGATDVNGVSYAFNDLTNQIETLDLLTGKGTPVGSFDPAAGVVQGATPVPEPSPIALATTSVVLIVILRRQKNGMSNMARCKK